MESPKELAERVETQNQQLRTAASLLREVGKPSTAQMLEELAAGTLFDKLLEYADKAAEARLNERREKLELELAARYAAKAFQLRMDYEICGYRSILYPQEGMPWHAAKTLRRSGRITRSCASCGSSWTRKSSMKR